MKEVVEQREKVFTKDALELLREAHDNCRGGHGHTVVTEYWLDRVKALLDEAKRFKQWQTQVDQKPG